jgi:hypothetical protein
MAIEYRIPLASMNREIWNKHLRVAPNFSRFDLSSQGYEYRAPTNRSLGDKPDVVIRIERNGLSITDYGDREIFESVQSYLCDVIAAEGQPFTLEDVDG